MLDVILRARFAVSVSVVQCFLGLPTSLCSYRFGVVVLSMKVLCLKGVGVGAPDYVPQKHYCLSFQLFRELFDDVLLTFFALVCSFCGLSEHLFVSVASIDA